MNLADHRSRRQRQMTRGYRWLDHPQEGYGIPGRRFKREGETTMTG